MRLQIFSPLLSIPDSADHEGIVLQRYPHANSLYEAPIFPDGCSSPCCQGEWVILDQPLLISDEVGRGPTEKDAWKDAAMILTAQEQEAA